MELPGEKIPDLTSLDKNLLKQKYIPAIENLYGGKQCSTCGMRFTNEQLNKFSNHYDWHFRQNRKQKEEMNKALSRNWFYNVSEWIQYEELSEDYPKKQEKIYVDKSSAVLDNVSSNDVDNSNIIQLNSRPKTSTCATTNDIDEVSIFFLIFIEKKINFNVI